VDFSSNGHGLETIAFNNLELTEHPTFKTTVTKTERIKAFLSKVGKASIPEIAAALEITDDKEKHNLSSTLRNNRGKDFVPLERGLYGLPSYRR